MGKLLWRAPSDVVANSRILEFINLVNIKYNKKFASYEELYKWSVSYIPEFWSSVWDYFKIITSQKFDVVVDDINKFPGAQWFVGAKLNFAENLLRYRNNKTALIFIGESQRKETITYTELYSYVSSLAESLRSIGVKTGDRVVGYMPNMIETVVAMLASTSLGAVWASCATDIGPEAAIDRFSQIEPKVLFTTNGYYYKGKTFDTLANVSKLVNNLPTLKKVIITPYLSSKLDINTIPNSIYINDFLSKNASNLTFEQVPANHPLYIMFSSGTTGKPKCMVQSVGGILINHLKELAIHSDIKENDTVFYITTCSWMMWNWLISSLALGATVVLYDGNPLYPDINAMWKLIQDEKITFFGCSASYINTLRSENAKPGKSYELKYLKEISQTGSPLSAEGFEYVYKEIKENVHFNSISGGTDINGCFVIGSVLSPVYAGELQSPGLGMKINVYDEQGNPIDDKEGELVCEAPAPSMPLYFWNDNNFKKYKETYFNYFAGKNVWRHGDYVIRHSKTGGYTFYGRSDSVLKPSGVRIGTAEIYNQVEKFEEIIDSLAIGQNWEGDQRLLLFVKMAPGKELTDELINRIKKSLRENASPRHVPAKIIQVPDIPYTFNMKKVESAVTNIIHNRPVTNRDALINPSSLDFFVNLKEIQT